VDYSHGQDRAVVCDAEVQHAWLVSQRVADFPLMSVAAPAVCATVMAASTFCSTATSLKPAVCPTAMPVSGVRLTTTATRLTLDSDAGDTASMSVTAAALVTCATATAAIPLGRFVVDSGCARGLREGDGGDDCGPHDGGRLDGFCGGADCLLEGDARSRLFSEHVIQRRGRWVSKCWKLYCCQSRSCDAIPSRSRDDDLADAMAGSSSELFAHLR